MDKINSAIGFLKDIGPTALKYVTYETRPNDYVSEFQEMQGKLKRRLSDVDANLETQLERARKIPKKEVEAWREKALLVTGENVVEDLICREGFFTNIRSSRKLDEKTQELNKIFMQGGIYTNASVDLVVDDHSIRCCELVFKENQEALKHQKESIEAILKTQCIQPGKIAREEVEEWLKKASQQIAIKVEDLIIQGESSSSSNLEKKTEELKQTFEQGEKYTNASVDLVVDDHSIEYCKTVFKEKQEQLKSRQTDIEAKLKTQLMQPGKIASQELKDWLEKASQQIPIKVEDLIPQGECPSSSNLRRKTEELKQRLEEGEKYTNVGEILVVDDHSIEYCVTVFKEKQEQLKLRQKDIAANLETQLKQYGKIASKEVEDWLKKACQQITIKVEDLISQGECSSSTNLRKKTKELKQILEEGKEFTNVGVNLVIDDHTIKGVPQLVECSGRDGIQEQILEWLKGDNVTRMAVWGMGGVGKTTIMKQVNNQLLKESKFNKVIWVTVSKNFDILKFQKRIASSLELKLEPKDHENETKLTGLISQRLGQGSFVLILDDVWEHFSLKDVGIPNLVGNNGCKLVLTTRSKDVAHAMDCEVIHVNPLPHDDALALFLEKVGNDVLSNGIIKRDIEPFLKQILQKCKGVPLAIVTVAKSMRGKPYSHSWKLALSEFSESSEVEGILDCLKFSYDCMELQCQECFLHCALYPEDYRIRKDELIEYWIDEGLIYKEGKTREAMNWKGHDILNKLVDNCLLVFPYRSGEFVSIHDLLREMALDIRPQFLVKARIGLEELPEEHEWREDLLKVSLMDNYLKGIPSSIQSPKCPMLTTLLLSNNCISIIPEAFFEHMLELKILDLSNNCRLSRLPSSISKLEKLSTLLLRRCESLKEVPSLSNLRGLKKLDIWETLIGELPQGLNMLTNLNYLCFWGPLLPDGLLQDLSKLQHLEVDEGTPLKGEEIGRLGKLEHLYGRFSTVHDLSIFSNSRRKFLNKYRLLVGSNYDKYFEQDCCNDVESKFIQCHDIDIDIYGEPNWLPSDVQCLEIHACHNASSFDNLNAVFGGVGAVANSARPPSCTFFSPKEITVYECHEIKKLFPVRWVGYLLNLQTFSVFSCEQMEEIIWFESKEGEKALEKVTLPKLEWLDLFDLPQLKSICSGSSTVLICDSIKKIGIGDCCEIESVFWSGFNPFPTLEELTLYDLENLKYVFDEEALGLSAHVPPTIHFPLKTISVYDCHQLKKVFSSGWLLNCFQSLETIQVRRCEQMEELISSLAYEEEKITLPKLQHLELTKLPSLKSICSNSSTVLICDFIERLKIIDCEKLKRIPLNLEKLKRIPLNFGLLDNAQSSHRPSLKEIRVFPKEWWESLEWDYPNNAKDIRLTSCESLFEPDVSKKETEEEETDEEETDEGATGEEEPAR